MSDETVDDRERIRVTEFVAARLMKSRARHFVYSERAKETGNPALGNIAALETQILHEAERDWRSTLRSWALASRHERTALLSAIHRAKERAEQDVRVAFDDPITCEQLAEFFESLKPEEMIPAQGAS